MTERIQHLITSIKPGKEWAPPGWVKPVMVETISHLTFTIEKSNIEDLSLGFIDTKGNHYHVSTEWSDANQGYTLDVQRY